MVRCGSCHPCPAAEAVCLLQGFGSRAGLHCLRIFTIRPWISKAHLAIYNRKVIKNIKMIVTSDLHDHEGGKLDIIGLGPGDPMWMAPVARDSIASSDVIVGYKTYIDLISPILDPAKEVLASGMRQEVERCRAAADLAISGKRVAMVCSGDPGIYGLAGLVLQILKGHPAGTRVEVDIIPGISALNACSSRLGAPLAHDFAVISLSDILTPWDIIVKRLHAAGQADFVVVIYNPRSRRRVTQLEEAVKILKEYREIFTPVGIVQRAMRQGESVKITTLSDLASQDIDMQTTIIVGNSQTFVWQDRMITPRGYIIP